MKKITLLILLLSIPAFGWTCSCMPLTKKDAKRITKKADFVILGTAVENIHPDTTIKRLLDLENSGIYVKFKVEKIYKGNLNSEYVYINQFETGNCIQGFRFGEKYIIVGTRIKYFENLNPLSEEDYNEDEITETFTPPPPPSIGGMTNNKMKCYNIDFKTLDFWNKIAEKEIVLYTNQCFAFHAESTYGSYFGK